jgi:hypothetical protein
MLIDVAVAGERNVIKTEAEKFLKCKDLTAETQRMWKLNKKGVNEKRMALIGSWLLETKLIHN